ncbi:MAG: hypothetical protein V7L00_02045 [Nostoc sp.]|uniref:hypothetical protein n=1 Tax=Nostoc sp. TaxID=1180 RepID=UPI002FF9413A
MQLTIASEKAIAKQARLLIDVNLCYCLLESNGTDGGSNLRLQTLLGYLIDEYSTR